MDIAARQSSGLDGRRGFPRPLVVVGLAAAAIGSGAILLLIFLMIAVPFTGVDNPPGWAWLKITLGLSESTLAAIAVGAPLAACLAGLVLGVAGWIFARRRSEAARQSKLTVLIALVGPIAIPVFLIIGYAVALSSSGGVPN